MSPLVNSSSDVYEQLHLAAWRMIERGIKPTADQMVSDLGGSKATAVAALRTFWTDYLPARISGQPSYAPDTVLQAANRLWSAARREALKNVEEELGGVREKLESQASALDEERQSMARLKARLDETLDRGLASLVDKQAAAAVDQRVAAELRIENERLKNGMASLQRLLDGLEAKNQMLQHELTRAQGVDKEVR